MLHYLTFDRNVAQYPLHHVTYSTTRFEVRSSSGLVQETCRTDGRMEDEPTLVRNKYTLFSKEKVGIVKKYLPASQNITHLICVNMLRSSTLA